MAHDRKDISVIAHANGFTMWHYTTPDTPEEVGRKGYFNESADMLRLGDVIVANMEKPATSTGMFAVTHQSLCLGGCVEVAPMTKAVSAQA